MVHVDGIPGRRIRRFLRSKLLSETRGDRRFALLNLAPLIAEDVEASWKIN